MKRLNARVLRRSWIAALLAVVSLLCLSACGNTELEEASVVLPHVDPDYFELFCQNCTVEARADFAGTNCTTFALLSATPLKQEDLKVTTSSQNPFVFALEDVPSGKSDYYDWLFLLYQGIKPGQIATYLRSPDALEEAEARRLDRLVEWLDANRESKVPDLYLYHFYFLPRMEEAYSFHDITIEINGISKTYPIESMTYITEGEDPPLNFYRSGDSPLAVWTFIHDGEGIPVTRDGDYAISGTEMEANDDVTLKAIRLYNQPDAAVLKAKLIITGEDGSTVNLEWDAKSDLPLKKGDYINVSVSVHDPETAGLFHQNRTRFLLFEYDCGDGQTYVQASSVYIWQREDNPYCYLAEAEGYDVVDYMLTRDAINSEDTP